MLRCILIALLALSLTAANAAYAVDLEAGHSKAKAVCAACHGENGISTSDQYPKLAGQPADYLEKALRDYRDGKRKNAIMAGFAQSLIVDPKKKMNEISDVAAWYSSQPGVHNQY